MDLLALRQDTLSILGQFANSKAGQLQDGLTTTPTITTTTTLNQYLNEAQNELARQVWPWQDTATATVALGSRGFEFEGMTSTLGGTIFSASAVTWNGISLRRIDQDNAYIHYPTVETDANGTPKNWSEEGLYGVLLYPWPISTQTVAVVGLATPPPLVADGDIPTFLPVTLHKYLPYYAAGKIAEKNVQNDDLAKRVQIWNSEWNEGKQELYGRALKTQKSLLERLEMLQAQGGK